VKVYIFKIAKIWGENMLKYAPIFCPWRKNNNNMTSRLKK
jgi:hypothetical protein